jgi:hypothetical protein
VQYWRSDAWHGVPSEMPAGPVRFILLVPEELRPEEDEAGSLWARGIAREWSVDLSDPHQDIYTLDDGRLKLLWGLLARTRNTGSAVAGPGAEVDDPATSRSTIFQLFFR